MRRFIASLAYRAALAAGLFLVPAQEPICLGRTDAEWTAAGYTVIVSNAAVINGTWKNDLIRAGSASSSINAGNGDDVVCAGDGDDTINGGSGDDVLLGGGGNDTLVGGARNDTLVGDSLVDAGPAAPPPGTSRGPGWYCGSCEPDPWGGNVYLFGRRFVVDPGVVGDDRLYTGEGGGGVPPNVGERMIGGPGDDYLEDTDGDTYLHGGAGNDVMIGGPGNDWAACGGGLDAFDGGLHQGGTDPVSGLSAVDGATADCEWVVNVP